MVALGLFGFARWRVVQSLLDADGLGRTPRIVVVRLGQMISAFAYAGPGVFAVSRLFGGGTGGGEEQPARPWTWWLLAQPFGRWIVGAIGLAIIGAGLGMAHKAWSGAFARHPACDHATATWVMQFGRLG